MADDASRRGTHGQGGAPAPRHAKHAAPRSQQASPAWRSGSAHPAARPAAHAAAARQSYRETEGRFPAADLANNSDVDSLEQAAPRPVMDPAETGSFQRIDASQGAVVTDRHNVGETTEFSAEAIRRAEQERLRGSRRPKVRSHEAKTKMSRPIAIVLIVVALVVIIVGVRLAISAIDSGRDDGQDQVAEQAQAEADGSIEYRGTTFSLQQQDDGTYALMGKTDDQDDATAYFTIPGTPVQLVLYNGALVIPENLPDGTWDVLAYTMGAGGVPTQVVDSDGNPVVGQGQIASVELQDPDLVVTGADGAVTRVALA